MGGLSEAQELVLEVEAVPALVQVIAIPAIVVDEQLRLLPESEQGVYGLHRVMHLN
jgi:hypothetical protein